MKYRREIDGLRAVAVLPVIFYHAGFQWLSGGFTGVDVFFVISGYLITSILISELEDGRYSIARFYERRAKRILPALFFVMLVCLPFAWLWMMPDQLRDFGESLAAVTVFSSNILFWREAGYFAASAELKPLLHTWSLAVEEQYYVVFPVFLAALWRLGRNRVFWIVVICALLSFLLCEWGWRNMHRANFYLSPFRAWELLAGSICAFLTVGRPRAGNGPLGLLGLVMVIVPIFAYDGGLPYPSFYALTPVIGTCLILLFAAPGNWAARILSTSPLVWVGLISYSAYLWHQPIFAFARLHSLTHPPLWLMGALGVLSLGLAYLSWRFVERPFRKSPVPFLPSRTAIFAASTAAGVIFIAIGMVGHFTAGLPGRLPDRVLQIAQASDDMPDKSCHYPNARRKLPEHPETLCAHPDDQGEIPVLLMGDSHAMALSETLGQRLQDAGIGYYTASYNSCLPLPGFRIVSFDGPAQCGDFVRQTWDYAQQAGIKTVVLTARYPLYLTGQGYDNAEGGLEGDNEIPLMDTSSHAGSSSDEAARRDRMLAGYEASIRELAQSYNVVLVYPIPAAGWNVPQTAAKQALLAGKASDTANLTTSYAAYKARTNRVTDLFDRLSTELPQVYATRPDEILCDEKTGRCRNADAEGVYYFDDDHLSTAGATLVSAAIARVIRAAEGDQEPKI